MYRVRGQVDGNLAVGRNEASHRVPGVIETVVASGVAKLAEVTAGALVAMVALAESWVPVAHRPPNMAPITASKTRVTEAAMKPGDKRS